MGASKIVLLHYTTPIRPTLISHAVGVFIYIGTEGIALVVTMGVLIWYTVETRKLRITTVKQTEFQIRPILSITLDTTGRAYLKNIGLSPPLNIKTTVMEAKHVAFIDIPIVERGIDKKVEFRIDGQKYDSLSTIEADVPVISISVVYENIEKQKYFTDVKVMPKKHIVEFLKTGEN